jgi:NADPH:quinone reductase-like Zn-dependent oxidoreductase
MAIARGQVPTTMSAVHLTGHGGFECLVHRRDVPTPLPGPGEVLVRVLAAGINNTDINTRIGWYSGSQAPEGAGNDGGWTGEGIAFPRIQGADVCGEIVSVGEGVSGERTGERVIIQPCLVSQRRGHVTPWLGSERDGGFAQFVVAPSADTHAVNAPLSDDELAAIPCAYGTAANLLARAGLAAGETVLVTGASGNVGLASVRLASLAGARVIAVAAAEKHGELSDAGAAQCLPRDAQLADAVGRDCVDVVIDVVGGPQWPQLLEVLRPGGRYAVSGAIAGPMVSLDLRKLYLKDLSFFGCTTQERAAFLNLVALVNSGRLRPKVALALPLSRIVEAQEEFLSKKHVGKIVLLPQVD